MIQRVYNFIVLLCSFIFKSNFSNNSTRPKKLSLCDVHNLIKGILKHYIILSKVNFNLINRLNFQCSPFATICFYFSLMTIDLSFLSLEFACNYILAHLIWGQTNFHKHFNKRVYVSSILTYLLLN